MKRFLFALLLLSTIFAGYYFEVSNYLTLTYLRENFEAIQALYKNEPFKFVGTYFLLYVLCTSLSIPGATIFTLAAGAIFGLFWGTILVSFASTIGATLSFLASRYILRSWVQKKFFSKMDSINAGIHKEGAFYLFTLRLIPIFPFFLINLLMGLTKMNTIKYFIVSQIGMLAGTIVYVNAGLQLSNIDSMKGILSIEVFLSFALLGIFPLVAKKIVEYIKLKRIYQPFKKIKPKKYDYDMIAIGGGAAGLVTSYITAAVKAKGAIIEKSKMGGDCLNTGCVPSKALIRAAHLVYDTKQSYKFGIRTTDVKVDFEQVMKRVQEVIKKIEPHDSIERYTDLGVDCLVGSAKIISPWQVKVNDKIISARNITLASGAEPFVPKIPGIEDVEYLTSDNLWHLKKLPKSLLILGAGPIGCELAQSFSRLGSKVTIVEMLNRIMAVEDPDVSEVIFNQFREENIDLKLGYKAISFEKNNSKKILICQKNGEEIKIEFESILIAVGRKPRVKGYGLEELGIELRKNGTIKVNEYLQTKYPNIFACGDVTGPYQFTHVASHQAWYCAVNGLFGGFKKFKVDYSVIPWCTYTDPEVATVGITEKSAKKQKISFEVTKYHLDDLDRAIADGNVKGFVKVLTVPGSDKIIGATIVGSQASNLIIEFVSAMKSNVGLNKILGSIHVYPSMGEANKFAAGVWKKSHSPNVILKFLEKYFRYKRK